MAAVVYNLHLFILASSKLNILYVKASAHSFKRFTSPPFLKLSFLSLCTYYLG